MFSHPQHFCHYIPHLACRDPSGAISLNKKDGERKLHFRIDHAGYPPPFFKKTKNGLMSILEIGVSASAIISTG